MFGSTWGNTNNQQQQPQQGGAFGQPSAFGSTNTNNAFGGSTSAFGQPAQPQANPMFGNLGGASTSGTGTTSAFGTFGGGTTANTSAFGLKPATGFGAFGGGTGPFGGGGTTSAFGQPANTSTTTTSAFGQPGAAAPTSAFGSTSTNPMFGATKFGAGTTATTTPPVVTTGTSNPPYAATTEQDGAVTHQYQSIVCMPAYSGYSFEELRVQDYAQNRKTATTGGAFGTGAFGAAQPATGIFGAQPAQPAQGTGLFGATNTAGPAPNAFGAFGTTPASNTTTSAFGTQPQQNAFGTTNTTTSAFGQPQTQPTNAFGGTGAFGATAPKPAFGTFGGTGTSAFGNNTTTAPSAFGTQPQQPAQNSLFGNTQPATNTTSAFGTGAFGNAANKPSIFGTTPAAPATGTFGFGTQNPTQPQQNQGTSLFGNNTGGGLFGNTQNQQPQNQPQQPATGLFGQSQQPQQTGGLFGTGATNTGGGLFGNTQNQQQNQAQPGQASSIFGGGIFNNKPAQQVGGGLFGTQPQNTQAQPNNLFGNMNQPAQQNSLFKPVAPTMGTSMSTSQAPMFGASMGAPQQQGTLTASINQPIAENVPLFSMLPPGPRILDVGDSPKKKPGFFVDIPTRSPVPRLQTYTPAASKLRGFSAPNLGASTGGNPFAASSSFANGRPGALSISKAGDNRSSSVGPEGFLGRSGSPALGSGARQSVKKVILDKKVDASELFVKNTSPGGLRSKVTFSPQLSMAAREKEGPTSTTSNHTGGESAAPTPSKPPRNTNRFAATKDTSTTPADDGDATTELGDGEYWTKPEMSVLKQVGFEELSSFKGLVVGRKGYGEIHFLEPVDLTGLPKLTDLLGDVVRFDDRECSVYPDAEDGEKPSPGSGLNVKARLILDRCWTVDKATREPIKDPNHPQSAKHLKRLKAMKETHFEDFDIKAGTWTFTVDHF